MPSRPPSPCTWPGCPELTHDGKCPEHLALTRKIADENRPSASKRGYDRGWQLTRQAKLRRNPYCETCGQPATDVDHIDGLGPNGPRGKDLTNLKSYCHPCHSRKTATQDGGFGREIIRDS